MDDTAQPNQSSDDAQQVPAQPVPVAGQTVTQPVAPSGVAHKEYAPISSPVAEHVQPAPHEAVPVIPEEAASHMEVAPNPEQPKLTDEHRKLGLSEAKESLPAPVALSDDSGFPLTAAQVTVSQSKLYSNSDSFKWYGRITLRQMLRKLFLKNDV